jgi:GNAT superfamily N-acetyltransferase
MVISIRTLSDTDLDGADAILQSAFQRTESWLDDLCLIRRIQPEGVFLACQNEVPTGMVTAVIYPSFAYVGLMGVHQDFQGRGIGLALMQHLLAWVDEQNVFQVRLDASPIGQPLYEKLGFVACDQVYVLQRTTIHPTCRCPTGIQHLSLHNPDLITALDTQAFGADRGRLLQALLETCPQRAFMLMDTHGNVNGYLIAQAKRIGPWVVENVADAELLLKAALSLPFDGPISVVLPGQSEEAVNLLEHYGFERIRVNRHMVLGPVAPVGQRGKIYAQASLSLG